jgi:hypothetical protein
VVDGFAIGTDTTTPDVAVHGGRPHELTVAARDRAGNTDVASSAAVLADGEGRPRYPRVPGGGRWRA